MMNARMTETETETAGLTAVTNAVGGGTTETENGTGTGTALHNRRVFRMYLQGLELIEARRRLRVLQLPIKTSPCLRHLRLKRSMALLNSRTGLQPSCRR